MLLLLMRHGIAEDREDARDDASRKLTQEGRERVAEIAEVLRKLDCTPTHYVASPRVRAQETASIVAETFEETKISTVKSLDFDGEWKGFVKEVHKITKGDDSATVLATGHEPLCGQFITNALMGSAEGFSVKKGAVAALDWKEPIEKTGATLRFYLTYSAVKSLKEK